MLEGIVFSPTVPVHSLGVLLYPGLLLKDQVAVAAGAMSTYYQFWLVRQLHPFLGKKKLVSVTHALITVMSSI